MAKVRFVSAAPGVEEREVEVLRGTSIQDAAVRAGVAHLELPCGGKGTCGQCAVELVDEGRMVMACQTRVTRDVVVRVPQMRSVALRVVGDSHFLVSEDLLPDPARLSPLFRQLRVTVPPASIEQPYSDWSRLLRQLPAEFAGASAPVSVLRHLARALREQDERVTVTAQETASGWSVVDVCAGHQTEHALGLAVDVGTTTVAAQLVDLTDGRVLATRTSYNQQLRRGADVITRIDYARTPQRQDELRALVLETVNRLGGEMAAQASVRMRDVRAAVVAGNTTMVHLLLGLDPRHIREFPYVPTVTAVPPLSAAEIGLSIYPDAVVALAPGVGSYLGGDITAGLLCTELPTNSAEVFLFLDVGTNGEIVIGNADWMVGCACSAGPAFEGSGIKCGMRAADGAIESIELAEHGKKVRYRVIGGGKPAGICGSGLISLLGELFRHGVVDQAGRFLAEPGTGSPTDSGPLGCYAGRMVESDGRPAFLVESASRTAEGENLVITQADLDNLVRTKAAIYAACSLILKKVGLEASTIARVYIAGGFGRYLQVQDAVLIGMLPDLPRERFSYIGNSSLTGAYIAMLSREHRQRMAEIAARVTYMDLSSDPAYMDHYVQALFLPHTDLQQFPSVAGLCGRK